MDDFYHEFLDKVHTLIEKEEYKEAIKLLDEEFIMPYIPKEYEEKMIEMYNYCRHEIKALSKEKKYDEEDIETLLNGSFEEACQAVELLKKSNIRTHLEIVETYLKNNPHFLIRTLLVEALIEQQVRDEIEMDYDGLDICFTPGFVELPQDQDVFVKAVKIVQSYYENDNPTFLQMCVETMMKEMYFRLPFALSEDEIYPFIYAVLLYVYKANDDKEGFKAMIHEKNLANYAGYDLLLYKYGI